jgi:hypothetical protein
MRFVLVGISLVLAWFAWWRNSSSTDVAEQDGHGQQRQQQQQQHQKQLPSSWRERGLLLLDMFSGKYLYTYVRGHVAKCDLKAH